MVSGELDAKYLLIGVRLARGPNLQAARELQQHRLLYPRPAAERGGDAVLSVNPNLLVVVEDPVYSRTSRRLESCPSR